MASLTDCMKGLPASNMDNDQFSQWRKNGMNYHIQRSYSLAESAFEKSLYWARKIASPMKERKECDVLISLAQTQIKLEKLVKAQDNLKKAESLCRNVDHEELRDDFRSRICSLFGGLYRQAGEYEESIEYHQKAWQVSVRLYKNPKDCESLASIYGDMGNAYMESKDLSKLKNARECFEAEEAIATSFCSAERAKLAFIYIQKCLIRQGSTESLWEAKANLERMISTWDKKSENYWLARNTLVVAQLKLKEYQAVINFYEPILEQLFRLETQEQSKLIGQCFCHLGEAYFGIAAEVGDAVFLEKAREAFERAIEGWSAYQQKMPQKEWQITIFEELFRPYVYLETVLLEQCKIQEALQITDSRRSRVLTSILSTGLDLRLYDPGYVKDLAIKLKMTFFIYSLVPLEKGDNDIRVWVVTEEGNISCYRLSELSDELQNPAKIFESYPYFIDEENKHAPSNFLKQLSIWYNVLIGPIEEHLPKNAEHTLAIIPDGFLAHLPFGAFRDKNKKFLIQKHPITIIPSVQVLQLLNSRTESCSESPLIVGNPTTPNPNDNNLSKAEREAVEVALLFKDSFCEPLTQKDATVDKVLQALPQARWVHLACHGVAQGFPGLSSVFKGFLKLGTGVNDSQGYLRAQEIAFLSLRANLVFMSACEAGRGKLQREGSISLVWSFLAAGALSTVATYWQLPENDTTVEMVNVFYRHLLGRNVPQLNKARALQKAALYGMEKNPARVRQWGAFFLSGLDRQLEEVK